MTAYLHKLIEALKSSATVMITVECDGASGTFSLDLSKPETREAVRLAVKELLREQCVASGQLKEEPAH